MILNQVAFKFTSLGQKEAGHAESNVATITVVCTEEIPYEWPPPEAHTALNSQWLNSTPFLFQTQQQHTTHSIHKQYPIVFNTNKLQAAAAAGPALTLDNYRSQAGSTEQHASGLPPCPSGHLTQPH